MADNLIPVLYLVHSDFQSGTGNFDTVGAHLEWKYSGLLQENIARKGELELELEYVAAANERELNTLYTTFWEDSSR